MRDSSLGLSVGSVGRRWVPPSSIKRDALTNDQQNDLTFRKVRGILNKLTPDKFDKLKNDILNIGIDDPLILKGLIFLIFEKALDEPHYCCMYAQLCAQLSERSKQLPDSASATTTFRHLLLNKCRDEFDTRGRINAHFESQGRDRKLTQEQAEQRSQAKRKMLGNIRFIGELGKLEMLHESILHRCVQQLLEKKKKPKQSVEDMSEDLECLGQIMKTCGRILDNEKAKPLVAQYFERMATLACNEELPPRIRFLLQDIIDLRRNKWRPRKRAMEKGPKTIQEIREEAARDLGVYIPAGMKPGDAQRGIMGPFGLMQLNSTNNSLFDKSHRHNQGGGGLDDLFGGREPFQLGTGPGVINPDFSFQNGSSGGSSKSSQPFDYPRQYQKPQQYPNFGQNPNYVNTNQNYKNNRTQQGTDTQYNTANKGESVLGTKELPPRFARQLASQNGSIGINGVHSNGVTSRQPVVSLRPSPQSMMLSPAAPSTVCKQNQGEGYIQPLPTASPPNTNPLTRLHKETQILIKQATNDNKKQGKRNTVLQKDETLRRVEVALEGVLSSNNVDGSVKEYKMLNIPDKFFNEVTAYIITKAIQHDTDTNGSECGVSQLMWEVLDSNRFLEGLRLVLSRLSDIESDTPKAKSKLAAVLSRGITAGFIQLQVIAELLDGGACYPLFILLLQNLHKTQGKQWLNLKFIDTKISLIMMLPENLRTRSALCTLLEERGLSYLAPLLTIQKELQEAIGADPQPTQFYKWVKDNVEDRHLGDPLFISSLVTVLVHHIIQETSGGDVEKLSVAGKQLVDSEKSMLEKYTPILQAFLHSDPRLQLHAVYALQETIHTKAFPKGMLLRWFVNLYDLEIIDDDVFLKWKEDIRDDYPGKGQALFQVRRWLDWLEKAESEEEEEEETK